MNRPAAAISSTFYRLRRLSRKIWLRSALIGLLGVVAAAGSGVLAPLVPDWIAKAVKPDAVEKILEIMASGMLAVVIFSLSVMVSSRQAASSQVTPRSHQLLLEDTTTQNVLATFLGSFLFSLVGVITLGTAVYAGDAAAVILFFALIVLTLMIVAILRWISHLSDLGSVVATTRKVEQAAIGAMEAWLDTPCMGGTPMTGDPAGHPVACRVTGYVQHIDIEALSDLAEDGDLDIYLPVGPGTYLSKGATLAFHTGAPDLDRLHEAFTLGDARRFDQDPRFGLIVLTEIAQRALSPGINDPGTAIDVITRQAKLLARFRDAINADAGKPRFPRIHVRPLRPASLLRDAFDPIARDGADIIEVQIKIQKALAVLAEGADDHMLTAIHATSARCYDRAMEGLALEDDKSRLHDMIVRLAEDGV